MSQQFAIPYTHVGQIPGERVPVRHDVTTGAMQVVTYGTFRTLISAMTATDIASGTITPRVGDVDLSGGSDGDVWTVQADGSAAFETPAPAGIGGSTGGTDNAVLASDGTGGSTLQATGVTVDGSNVIYATAICATGVGNVGKAVIKRAHAFGMTIIATDPITPSADFLAQYDVKMVSLEDLLKNADYVSTNCDLNPSSQHIMNAETFALMKPTAVLINTARGPLIDEKALVSALQNGEIAGVAMDVFEDEPLPDSSSLRQMDNVMLAPHNSNSSPTAWEHVHHNTIKNLLDVLGLSDD